MLPQADKNLLHLVSKPLKYLGSEMNLNKRNCEGGLEKFSKILLIYPGLYEQMLNNPWFEALYHSLNEQQNFLVDFVFLPDEDFLENSNTIVSTLYNLSFTDFDLMFINADHEGQIPVSLHIIDMGGIPISGDFKFRLLFPPLANLPVFSKIRYQMTSSRNPQVIKNEIQNLFEIYEGSHSSTLTFKEFWVEFEKSVVEISETEISSGIKKTINPLISWIDTTALINKNMYDDVKIPLSYLSSDFPFSINLKEKFTTFEWKMFSLYTPFWSWIKDKNWFEKFSAAKIKSWPVSVELNDAAKAEFISFIKKYPYPVVLSDQKLSDILIDPSDFFSFLEEIYKDDWDSINFFIQLAVAEQSISNISDFYQQLKVHLGKLKVKFFIQPEFGKLIENGINLTGVWDAFEEFSEKLKTSIDKENIVLPSREYMINSSALFQNDVSIIIQQEKPEIEEFSLISATPFRYFPLNFTVEKPDLLEEENAANRPADTSKPKLGFNGKPMQFGRAVKRVEIIKPLMKKIIRIKYTKGYEAIFFSHLDVIRVFDKLSKKAGIKILYKQGKNPRPRISFAPPLNVGFLSKAEYMDLHLEISENESLKFKLNSLLPKGIQIIEEKLILEKTPSLSSSIEQNDYSITGLNQFNLQWISEFMGKDSVCIKRIKQDEEMDFDVRPFVEQMDWKNDTLTITVKAIENKMARVIEILEALLPQGFFEPHKFTCIRTGQYAIENGERIDPMRL